MSKFTVYAYADMDVNRDPEPWLEDIREFETDSVEVEADTIEEMEELAWELLEEAIHCLNRECWYEFACEPMNWELWWREA